jgi:flagellar motor switch/type III secretory pathway protein FliN
MSYSSASNEPAFLGHPPAPAKGAAADADESAQHLARLPAYSRSLLRIEVPVVVTLAMTRLPVSRITDLGPGAIIHFDKSYDGPLTLSVGSCEVAVGEAVKIGERFGIRISSMVMPREKFEPVRAKAAERRS